VGAGCALIGGRVGCAVLSAVGSKGMRVGVAGAVEDKLHANNIDTPDNNSTSRRMFILLAQLSYKKARKANRVVEKRKNRILRRTRFHTGTPAGN
jgi:hypothetical protein